MRRPSWSPVIPRLQGLCSCWRAWEHLTERWSLAYVYVLLPPPPQYGKKLHPSSCTPAHFPGPPNPRDPLTLQTGWAEFGRAGEPQSLLMLLMLPHWRRGWSQRGAQGQCRSRSLVKRDKQCFYWCLIIRRMFGFVCSLNRDAVTGSWASLLHTGAHANVTSQPWWTLCTSYVKKLQKSQKGGRKKAIYSRNTGSDQWNTHSDHLDLLKGSVRITYEKRC